MNNIKEVLEGVYSNPSLRKSIIPLFIGKTGIGKTSIIKQFAKEKNVNIVEFIASQRSHLEISGIMMPVNEKKSMEIFDFNLLIDMKDGDILFFDEILNGSPLLLSACLTLLENRETISGKKLPDIMIVAAANFEGMCPLTPQIKERFVMYETFFNNDLFIQYTIDKFNITYGMGVEMCKLIKDENFLKWNFNTPRSIHKAIDMIIHGVTTPYKPIQAILNTPIINTTGEEIILPNGTIIKESESIRWLDLIKYYKNEITKK